MDVKISKLGEDAKNFKLWLGMEREKEIARAKAFDSYPGYETFSSREFNILEFIVYLLPFFNKKD